MFCIKMNSKYSLSLSTFAGSMRVPASSEHCATACQRRRRKKNATAWNPFIVRDRSAARYVTRSLRLVYQPFDFRRCLYTALLDHTSVMPIRYSKCNTGAGMCELLLQRAVRQSIAFRHSLRRHRVQTSSTVALSIVPLARAFREA